MVIMLIQVEVSLSMIHLIVSSLIVLLPGIKQKMLEAYTLVIHHR